MRRFSTVNSKAIITKIFGVVNSLFLFHIMLKRIFSSIGKLLYIGKNNSAIHLFRPILTESLRG